MRLAQIWRYPLKSVGRERLAQTRLNKGEKIPFDRYWAVLHEAAAERLDSAGSLNNWLPKTAFVRGAAGPELQAVTGGMEQGRLALQHPSQGKIVVDPTNEADADRLIAWLKPLWPENKPAPLKLVSGPVPLTDTREPFISINSLNSLSELENHVGERLGVERWRGNLWIEGNTPFSEQEWIGREISVGTSRLIIREAIGRCSAPAVDTETGNPDWDIIRILSQKYGHSNFGVYAEVLEGGEISELDPLVLHQSVRGQAI